MKRLALIASVAAALAAAATATAAPPAASPTASAAPESPAPLQAVPVHIAGLRAAGDGQVMLLLADAAKKMAVPLAVGRDQGVAIAMGKEKTTTPRPMTHDLLLSVVGALQGSVDRITVTELRGDTYIAEIALNAGGKVRLVDARPSDAVALAVRAGAPMFCAVQLLRPMDSLGRPDAMATWRGECCGPKSDGVRPLRSPADARSDGLAVK